MDRHTDSRTPRAMGERVRTITRNGRTFEPPEAPTVPVGHGDGVGSTVVPAAQRVLETAAHVVDRRLHWLPVPIGEAGRDRDTTPLPADTLETFREFKIGLIGPTAPHDDALTSPLDTWLRHELDCRTTIVRRSPVATRLRPAPGTAVGSLAVVYDITEGCSDRLVCPPESGAVERARRFAREGLLDGAALADGPLSVGLRPFSRAHTARVLHRAIDEAHARNDGRLTVVHQGDRLSHTDGSLRDWAYDIGSECDDVVTDREPKDSEAGRGTSTDDEKSRASMDGDETRTRIVLDDQPLERVLDRLHTDPTPYELLVAPPQAGRTLARTIVGIGTGPGMASACHVGTDRFLATPAHGPRSDMDADGADPTSTILAGAALFRAIGWTDAADLLIEALQATFDDGSAPRNVAARFDGASAVTTEAFVDRVVTALEERASTGSIE